MEKECLGHKVTGLSSIGAICGATTFQPPILAHRVGNMLQYISGRFKVHSRWLVYAYSSHFIRRVGTVEAHTTKGVSYGRKANWYHGCKGTALQPDRVGS
jgi:hypothetical protein